MASGLNIVQDPVGDEAEDQSYRPQASSSTSPSLPRVSSLSMRPPPVPHSTSSSMSSTGQPMDNTGVGSGPGKQHSLDTIRPLRHLRPLTVSDLHSELEKEQEAVVNRLTRELTLLRAQTASVASTTSSTSTNIHDASEVPNSVASPRAASASRHRSSSTLSSRSMTGGASYSSVANMVPARETSASSRTPGERHGRSREASALSPELLPSPAHDEDRYRPAAPQRRSESVSSVAGTLRYEEAARQRAELEAVRRENESLRARVRELEKILRDMQLTMEP